MKCIITVGISGSGKSTWAESQTRIPETYYPVTIINRDETRWEVSGKRGWKGDNAYRFDKDVEKAVTSFNLEMIYDAAYVGKDVIISDTNLNPVFRDKLIGVCKSLGYEVEIKEFPISFQEACKRDKERGIFAVGEVVLMKQWCDWIRYWEEKQQGAW